MLDLCEHGLNKFECGICRKELKITPSIKFFEQPKKWELEQIPIGTEFNLCDNLRKTIQPPEFINNTNSIPTNLKENGETITNIEKRSKLKEDIVKSPDLVDVSKKFLKKED